MEDKSESIRVATYNVHRCRGIDGRTSAQRIVEVLREVDAQVVALQEVLSAPGGPREHDQARYIADELGLRHVSGVTREWLGGIYGNVALSRFPIVFYQHFDISVRGREERGCLRADLDLNGVMLHVFNVHLGTSFRERREQAELLIAADLLEHEDRSGPRVVLGDFNEWTYGLVSKLLSARFRSVDIEAHLRWPRTYPGILPLLHLDHIYHDPDLRLESLRLHRTKASLWASDHLPLVAEFRLSGAGVQGGSNP